MGMSGGLGFADGPSIGPVTDYLIGLCAHVVISGITTPAPQR